MIHETLPNKRKFKKIMQSPPTKSPPFSYDSGFLPKKKTYYAFINKLV